MYRPNYNRFRQDLTVVLNTDAGNDAISYFVKNPSSKQIFEFVPEEIYICLLMNGNLTPTEIISRFEEKFNYRLESSEFKFFSTFLDESDLLETYHREPVLSAVQDNHGSTQFSTDKIDDEPSKTYQNYANSLVSKFENQHSNNQEQKKNEQYKFSLFNPDPLFKTLLIVSQPFYLLLSIWLFLPVFILSILTLLYNSSDFILDLNFFIKNLPFFQRLTLSLLLVNMSSKVVQGVTIIFHGGKVGDFGCKLEFGFFPLFYINKQGIKKLSRTAKLSIFSAPIFYRLSLFSLCILTWFLTRATQSGLTTLVLTFSQSAMIGLLIDLSPFWKSSNGYLWLTTYFNIYRLYDRAMQVGAMTLARRPLPKKLLGREKIVLYSYVILFVLLITSIIISLAIPIATLLEKQFQGTGVVLFCLLLALILRWYRHESSK